MTSQETVGEQHALSMSRPACALIPEFIPVVDVSLTMFADLGAPRTHQTYLSSSSKNCATPKRQRACHALNPTLKLGTLLFEWPEITVATLNQSRSPTALLELGFFLSDVDEAYVDKCIQHSQNTNGDHPNSLLFLVTFVCSLSQGLPSCFDF